MPEAYQTSSIMDAKIKQENNGSGYG